MGAPGCTFKSSICVCPPKRPVSSLLGAARGMLAEPLPCPAHGQPHRPGCALRHQALLVFQPVPWEEPQSPPAGAPQPPSHPPRSTASSPTSRVPWAGPVTKSSATAGFGCMAQVVFQGVGLFGGEIFIFHGCFCPPGTFLAAFPSPLVSWLLGYDARSIPSHRLSLCRRVLGCAVPPGRHLHRHLPARSQALSHVLALSVCLSPWG